MKKILLAAITMIFISPAAFAGDFVLYTEYQAFVKDDAPDIEAVKPAYEAFVTNDSDTDIELKPANVEATPFTPSGTSDAEDDVISHFDPRHAVEDCLRDPLRCRDLDIPSDMPETVPDDPAEIDVPGSRFGGTLTDRPPLDVGDVPDEEGSDIERPPVFRDDTHPEIPSIDVAAPSPSCPTCPCTTSAPCAGSGPSFEGPNVSYAEIPLDSIVQEWNGSAGCGIMNTNPSTGIVSAIILAVCTLPLVLVRKKQ